MKLTVLGGGGFRTPNVYSALLGARDRLPVDDLVLHDAHEERLRLIGLVLEGMAGGRGDRIPYRVTTDLGDAVDGADAIFCAIRVGGLEGRVVDETVPLEFGVLGQETVGPGGICFALRTLPAMMEIAEVVARRAPDAWFVNFTNPAGLVTEALRRVLGDRAIGICDSASSLCRNVAAALGRRPEDLWFDYVGLNHLGWLRSVSDGHRDVLPDVLADDRLVRSFEEGELFGPDRLREIRVVPNEYLAYYEFADRIVEAFQARGETRGQYLLRQQAAFYRAAPATPDDAYRAWLEMRRARHQTYMAEVRTGGSEPPAGDTPGQSAPAGAGHEGGVGGYEGVAMAVVEALVRNLGAVLILEVGNRGSLPFLDEEAVVEVPCVVGATGAHPVASGAVADEQRALIERVKEVERATIEAALTGSADLAVRAMALHPVVPSAEVAERIFQAYLDRQPGLQQRFAA